VVAKKIENENLKESEVVNSGSPSGTLVWS